MNNFASSLRLIEATILLWKWFATAGYDLKTLNVYTENTWAMALSYARTLTKAVYSWFKWLQNFKADKETVKAKNIIVRSTTRFIDCKIKQCQKREPIFV